MGQIVSLSRETSQSARSVERLEQETVRVLREVVICFSSSDKVRALIDGSNSAFSLYRRSVRLLEENARCFQPQERELHRRALAWALCSSSPEGVSIRSVAGGAYDDVYTVIESSKRMKNLSPADLMEVLERSQRKVERTVHDMNAYNRYLRSILLRRSQQEHREAEQRLKKQKR